MVYKDCKGKRITEGAILGIFPDGDKHISEDYIKYKTVTRVKGRLMWGRIPLSEVDTKETIIKY